MKDDEKMSQGRRGLLAMSLDRYWPAHLRNPGGLLLRIAKSGNRAALFTVGLFGVTLLATPLDFLLSYFERRYLRVTRNRQHPVIFICGPARSGTTITHQLLVGTLPVSYFSNLTAIFPRSPLTAYRLFRWIRGRPGVGTESFYGKTRSLAGPNDADHIWCRWVDADAHNYRTQLNAGKASKMAQFFNAMEHCEGSPIVAKNNKLLAFAADIDRHVENAWYICLRRDPAYLAQSLIIAAQTMHGDANAGYGVADASQGETATGTDPVDVAIQRVSYGEQLTTQQQQAIGSDRFWVVNYEDVCANPVAFVQRVARDILGVDLDAAKLEAKMPTLTDGNRVKVDKSLFDDIQARLAEIAADETDSVAAARYRIVTRSVS